MLGTSSLQTTATGSRRTRAGTGANLPFTGFDLAFVRAASVALVGLGYSLRRLTRKPPAS